MTRSVRSLGLLALLREGGTTAQQQQPTRDLSDCSLARLSEHERETMQLHARGLFIDPTCSQSDVEKGFGQHMLHCNMFDIGQDCRGCFSTCDGALAYLFSSSAASEYSLLDLAFCADSGVVSVRDCEGVESSTGGNSHRMVGSNKGNAKNKRWQKSHHKKKGRGKYDNGAPVPMGFDHTRDDWMSSPYPNRLLTSDKNDGTRALAGWDYTNDFATTSATDMSYAYDFGTSASADLSYTYDYGTPGPSRAPSPSATSPPWSYDFADDKDVDDGDLYNPDPTPSPAARGPDVPSAAGAPAASPSSTAPVAPEMPVVWDYTMPVGPDPPQSTPSPDAIIGPATAPSAAAAAAVPTTAPARTPGMPVSPEAVPTPTPTSYDIWHPFDPVEDTPSPVVGDSSWMPAGHAMPVDTAPQAAPTPALSPTITIATDDEERPNDDVDVVVSDDEEEEEEEEGSGGGDDDDGLWPDGPGDDYGDYKAGGSGSAPYTPSPLGSDGIPPTTPSSTEDLSYVFDFDEPTPAPAKSSDTTSPDAQESYSFDFDFDFDFSELTPAPTPHPFTASPAEGGSYYFDFGSSERTPVPTPNHSAAPVTPPAAAPSADGSYSFEYAEDEDENDELDCFGLLSPGAKEQLGGDQGVFHDKDCQGTYCNMFGVAQDCRRCYLSCAIREEDTATADLYMCPSEHYPKVGGKAQEWASACGSTTTGIRRLRGG